MRRVSNVFVCDCGVHAAALLGNTGTRWRALTVLQDGGKLDEEGVSPQQPADKRGVCSLSPHLVFIAIATHHLAPAVTPRLYLIGPQVSNEADAEELRAGAFEHTL